MEAWMESEKPNHRKSWLSSWCKSSHHTTYFHTLSKFPSMTNFLSSLTKNHLCQHDSLQLTSHLKFPYLFHFAADHKTEKNDESEENCCDRSVGIDSDDDCVFHSVRLVGVEQGYRRHFGRGQLQGADKNRELVSFVLHKAVSFFVVLWVDVKVRRFQQR